MQIIKLSGKLTPTIHGNNCIDTGLLIQEMLRRADYAERGGDRLYEEHLALTQRRRTPKVSSKDAVARAIAYVKGGRPMTRLLTAAALALALCAPGAARADPSRFSIIETLRNGRRGEIRPRTVRTPRPPSHA